MEIDKKALLQAINVELNNIKDIAVAGAKPARNSATPREKIAESRYDTLGREAAYLAHGQTQRALKCKHKKPVVLDVGVEFVKLSQTMAFNSDSNVAAS